MTSFEAVVESHIKRWITGRRLADRVQREQEPEPEPHIIPPPIAFSCAYGSGAQEIINNVSELLGYQVFDRVIMEAIGRSTRAQSRIIEALDEGDRNRFSFMTEQLFSKRVITDDGYFHTLVRVVRFLALLGPASFIGRGTCHILRDGPVLSVRIVAALEDRVKRIAEREGIDPEAAERKVEERDQAKRRYIRSHFNREIDDPEAYHLIVNTSRIAAPTAVELIQSLHDHERGAGA